MLSKLSSLVFSMRPRSKSRRLSDSQVQQQRRPSLQANRRQFSSEGPSGFARQNSDRGFREDTVSMDYADDDEVSVATPLPVEAAEQPEPELSENGPLAVTTRVEYSALPRDRSQDIYGLVTVQAAAANLEEGQRAAGGRPPVDIICVLDVSGSMQGSKIGLVKDAVRFVIDELRPEDRLSLVTFNSRSERVLRMRRMDTSGKDEAHRLVCTLSAGGGTSIANGLETGLAVAEKRRQRNPVTAILLLTDGRDSHSGRGLPALVQRARASGCSLYGFGFGEDHDAALLSGVAEQAQTPFSYVEDVDTIKSTFAGAVGGLVSITAQRIELTLDCRCTLKTAHTPFEMQRTASGGLKIKIPDMLAGERRDILVELNVAEQAAPPEAHVILLEASARYWDLCRSLPVQTPSVPMLASPPSPDAPQPEAEVEPDAEVSAQRCRVEATRALDLAREHGEAGRFDEARSVLLHGQQRFKTSPQTALSEAMALELEAAVDRLQDGDTWEAGGRAELADMYHMNRMQRATNLNGATRSKCAVRRTSMGIYTNSVQKTWIRRSAA